MTLKEVNMVVDDLATICRVYRGFPLKREKKELSSSCVEENFLLVSGDCGRRHCRKATVSQMTSGCNRTGQDSGHHVRKSVLTRCA